MKYLQSVRKWSTIKWGILYMWCLYFSGQDRKLVKLLCKIYRDFLGGPVVKNWLSNAGVMGSIPDGGTKIPHATGKLSPWAATREKSTCCNSWAWVLQSPCSMIWTFLPSLLCWFFSKGGKDLGFTVNNLGSHRRVLSINMRWLIYDRTGSLWLLCSEKIEGRQRKQGALSEGNNLSRKGLGSGCKEARKVLAQDVKKHENRAHRMRSGMRKRRVKDSQDFWPEQLTEWENDIPTWEEQVCRGQRGDCWSSALNDDWKCLLDIQMESDGWIQKYSCSGERAGLEM